MSCNHTKFLISPTSLTVIEVISNHFEFIRSTNELSHVGWFICYSLSVRFIVAYVDPSLWIICAIDAKFSKNLQIVKIRACNTSMSSTLWKLSHLIGSNWENNLMFHYLESIDLAFDQRSPLHFSPRHTRIRTYLLLSSFETVTHSSSCYAA